MDKKDTDLISRFLDLKLSEEELISFEKKMKEDATFYQKVMTYHKAVSIVDQSIPNPPIDTTIISSTKDIISINKTTMHIMHWKWIAGIAAVFLLFFGISQFSFFDTQKTMNQHITNAWTKEIGLNFKLTRGNNQNEELKSKVQQALNAYNEHKYTTTLDLLASHPMLKAYYEEVLLLRGLSYYKINKLPTALETLDSLKEYHTGKKSKAARWYIGLIHLEQDSIHQAREYINIPKNAKEEITLKEE